MGKEKMSAKHFRSLIKHGELDVSGKRITSKKLQPEFKKLLEQGEFHTPTVKDKLTTIELYYLPKISLNKFYAGVHWTKRKQMKDAFKQIVRKQTNYIGTKPCTVHYNFEFKSRPLDASNTIGMVKMIEDILFEDDSYKIIVGMFLSSKKGTEDKLTIRINEV